MILEKENIQILTSTKQEEKKERKVKKQWRNNRIIIIHVNDKINNSRLPFQETVIICST